MATILHILKSTPDHNVARLIDALSGEEGATVVSLYQDNISGQTIDWRRLVDDIFTYDKVICWW
jgi:hypothetical protein